MTDEQSKTMHLLPFKVKSVSTQVNEIPYGVHLHQAHDIWAKGEEGEGIVVAVLDTGIDSKHSDLKNNIVGGRNFTNEGNANMFEDGNGHGTHVAGVISANGRIKGIAPKSKILVCKVLDSNGSGGYDSIINGIKYATNWRGENGERVRIINMSLGGAYKDPRMEQAILNACSKGIIVSVASGNEGDGNEDTFEYAYPSLIQECVTVGACDENKKMAYFTNNHLQVDVIGAGVDVLSTYPLSNYAKLSGTSMATPHISGVLALLIKLGETKFRRELTESEIYALLTQTCCSLGYKASTEGHGMPELTRFFEDC